MRSEIDGKFGIWQKRLLRWLCSMLTWIGSHLLYVFELFFRGWWRVLRWVIAAFGFVGLVSWIFWNSIDELSMRSLGINASETVLLYSECRLWSSARCSEIREKRAGTYLEAKDRLQDEEAYRTARKLEDLNAEVMRLQALVRDIQAQVDLALEEGNTGEASAARRELELAERLLEQAELRASEVATEISSMQLQLSDQGASGVGLSREIDPEILSAGPRAFPSPGRDDMAPRFSVFRDPAPQVLVPLSEREGNEGTSNVAGGVDGSDQSAYRLSTANRLMQPSLGHSGASSHETWVLPPSRRDNWSASKRSLEGPREDSDVLKGDVEKFIEDILDWVSLGDRPARPDSIFGTLHPGDQISAEPSFADVEPSNFHEFRKDIFQERHLSSPQDLAEFQFRANHFGHNTGSVDGVWRVKTAAGWESLKGVGEFSSSDRPTAGDLAKLRTLTSGLAAGQVATGVASAFSQSRSGTVDDTSEGKPAWQRPVDAVRGSLSIGTTTYYSGAPTSWEDGNNAPANNASSSDWDMERFQVQGDDLMGAQQSQINDILPNSVLRMGDSGSYLNNPYLTSPLGAAGIGSVTPPSMFAPSTSLPSFSFD